MKLFQPCQEKKIIIKNIIFRREGEERDTLISPRNEKGILTRAVPVKRNTINF